MKCSRCGSELSSHGCPSCGATAAQEQIIGYGVLPRPLFTVAGLERKAKAFAGRRLGRYRRFLAGNDLEPDEREMYRVQLRAVSEYAVDRRTVVVGPAVCILTDRRLMIRDDHGCTVQIPREKIRAAWIQREDDVRTGPSWVVALERVGQAQGLQGDLWLLCPSRQECARLIMLIQETA